MNLELVIVYKLLFIVICVFLLSRLIILKFILEDKKKVFFRYDMEIG